MAMKGINGQLSSLPITDLMQWIDMNRKSGVLIIYSSVGRICFCYESGKLVMASSDKGELVFAKQLIQNGHLSEEHVKAVMNESVKNETCFVANLIEGKFVSSEFVETTLQQIARDNIVEALTWGGGSFGFIEELPPVVTGSPVKINSGGIVFDAVRVYDEIKKKAH